MSWPFALYICSVPAVGWALAWRSPSWVHLLPRVLPAPCEACVSFRVSVPGSWKGQARVSFVWGHCAFQPCSVQPQCRCTGSSAPALQARGADGGERPMGSSLQPTHFPKVVLLTVFQETRFVLFIVISGHGFYSVFLVQLPFWLQIISIIISNQPSEDAPKITSCVS